MKARPESRRRESTDGEELDEVREALKASTWTWLHIFVFCFLAGFGAGLYDDVKPKIEDLALDVKHTVQWSESSAMPDTGKLVSNAKAEEHVSPAEEKEVRLGTDYAWEGNQDMTEGKFIWTKIPVDKSRKRD